MYQQTKGRSDAGKSGSSKIALGMLNTNYNEYIARATKVAADRTRPKFFAAGLFIDKTGKALLVQDCQDGNPNKVWFKIPGGVADGCFSQETYCSNLYDQLVAMKYSSSLIKKNMDVEEKQTRTVGERGMILEMIEETGYYPKEFGFGLDGYRYNRETNLHDLWQIYFEVRTILSPYSKSFDEGIKNIRKAPAATALDKDVKDMRAVVDYNELINKLGPFPQKKAAQMLLKRKASYFMSVDNYELSKKYGLAAAVQVD